MISKKQSVVSFDESSDKPGRAPDESTSQPVQVAQALMDSARALHREPCTVQALSSHVSCLHHLFEVQVERTPNALALTFRDQWLTYQDLNNQANQLAHYLQKQGVRPGILVGICLERSVEMIVSILGVLKAGGAYLPLDPAYPLERLSFMLQDADVQFLLTSQGCSDKLFAHHLPVIRFEQDLPVIAQEPTDNPTSAVTPHDLAYIIYTSGSTGKPKGVMLEHYGLGNMLEAQILAFGLQADDRIAQFASFSFDASVSEMFMTFLCGAHLFLVPREWRWPAPILQQFLQEHSITAITLPPSALTLMQPETLPLLRVVISAGEELSAEIVRRWAPGRHLFNAYGPTEGTVCTTIGRCHVSNRRPSIGKPIHNVQVYLLDSTLQPVPEGATGEIYIGGMGLARGYVRRPELTREKFIPHPFSAEPGARLYKTGDLARLLPDGTIECIGRVDRMIKIRGFRVELGEVEAVLEQHPLVAQSLILVYKDSSEVERLAAYVLLDPRPIEHPLSHAFVQEELSAFLQTQLPKYMQPTKFVILEAFPLTPAGKIDQRALIISE